jgi:hypothetical protein
MLGLTGLAAVPIFMLREDPWVQRARDSGNQITSLTVFSTTASIRVDMNNR